ncbi:MAG: NAD-dependent epimerase/dehydratase family protein [Deltaproteobacteria bacterium]|nr:NAD-dependent epimerase/dehydratase family protein [Deltaproteobacteria bacterium]
MKKVLVTGSIGFVGRQSLSFLLEMDYEVHAVSSVFPRITQSEVKWHRADLLDQKQIKELLILVKPTHLLHFAWYAIQGVSGYFI